ncbi:MAG: YCF48-related protein [bacterium]
MQKIQIVLVLFGQFISFHGFPQWQWQNPLPQGNSLINIRFFSASVGYAVGAGGTIMKTEDAGETWSVKNSGTTVTLLDIHFPTAETGYASGGSVIDPTVTPIIIRTNDGGESWETVFSDTLGPIRTLFFTSVDTGFAGGYNGLVLKTDDGGSDWDLVDVGTSGKINQILFTDPSTGFIIGDSNTLLKTIDYGNTWFSVAGSLSPGIDFLSISFPSPFIGYVLGEDPIGSNMWIVAKTTDGGDTWLIVTYSVDWLESIEFMTPDSGFAGGFPNRRTIDGGVTWESLETYDCTGGFDFIDGNTGFFVYGDETEFFRSPIIEKTSDFGSTTEDLTEAVTRSWFTDITFPEWKTGYIVGGYQNGIVLKTSDGYHWESVFSTASYSDTNFQMCFFLDKDYGYICGSFFDYMQQLPIGLVARTSNGGTTWDFFTIGTPIDPSSIFFTGYSTGFITGWDEFNQQSYLFRTLNGGVTWDPVLTDTLGIFAYVYFPVVTVGYAVKCLSNINGGGTGLWKTTDGGTTWSYIYECDTISPQMMDFVNEDTGYMTTCSYPPVILKTIDGGYSWTILPGILGSPIDFLDPETGFVLRNNHVWETVDGGITWTEWEFITSNWLTDFFFFSQDTGYVIGEMGTILFTPDDFFPVYQTDPPGRNRLFLTNYPNPFSGQTTICYTLTEKTNVTIEIFTLSGARIQRLVDQEQGSGNYKIPFNAATLPSGAYYYCIRTNDNTETKKLIIIH